MVIEQTFGLCGRRRGWDVSKEQHRNVYCLGWNRSPAQVGCMRQALRPGALGRPRGMGNTCKPMADSFQCMTKPTAIKKKKLKKKYDLEMVLFSSWEKYIYHEPLDGETTFIHILKNSQRWVQARLSCEVSLDKHIFKKVGGRDFPSGPVAKTLCSQHSG